MGVPLVSFVPGSKVEVECVDCEKSMAAKLGSLGLYPHCQLAVVHRATNGSMVILVGHTRMALDVSLARLVKVSPI